MKIELGKNAAQQLVKYFEEPVGAKPACAEGFAIL